MIEDKVREFLESKLSVPVLMEVPKGPEPSFVVIEKTGSSQINLVSTSILTIQSYAPSLYEAALLNDLVKDWMLDGMVGLITLDRVSNVSLNSDYNYTDTSTKKYRYQALFEVTHY